MKFCFIPYFIFFNFTALQSIFNRLPKKEVLNSIVFFEK